MVMTKEWAPRHALHGAAAQQPRRLAHPFLGECSPLYGPCRASQTLPTLQKTPRRMPRP